MTGKKSAKEKKRKHSHSEGRRLERKRRITEPSIEDLKGNSEDQDEQSDIEEGGLNLNVPFKPISAYVTDKQELLEQCFRVIGEKKLMKMLPDELKSCTCDEIKQLCMEQLQQLSQKNLLHILEGDDFTGFSDIEEEREKNERNAEMESQQDNNVDSTSSLKENVEQEDLKQGGASGEESDALSINADAYDSDIEGHKEETEEKKTVEVVESPVVNPPSSKKELQSDIEKSVNEILALGGPSPEEPKVAAVAAAATEVVVVGAALSGPASEGVQPSAQQLELLELEMRARAIKALMKANEVKKQACG
ncbi:caspase activity and apoptosis inhibitor 1-like isoform X2 [Acipenser ruthenus]|uniref:caspase activity and apoptosis inhibitor 1-like isoform X2 n=1 Tax=Acipenser ruthenus TaxID=7906 RepID=UPI00145B28F6|nr:caspase activity and apoptosis inhibitor 1-like isoform X2 [Acipenser ruthenus]